MKLKIIVKIVEKLLGMTNNDNEPRADMFLPDRLLAFALVLFAGGITCTLFAIFNFALWAVICAIITIVLGVFAVLCWRNQSIHIISSEQFTYTTMFGNTYTYSFSEIQELRRNQDSLTLFVADKKVHIEVIQNVINCVKSLNYAIKGLTYSSIKGPAGNIEYLIWFTTENIEEEIPNIQEVVENAHNTLN